MHPTSTTTRSRKRDEAQRGQTSIGRLVTATAVGCAVVAINLLQACGFTGPRIQSPQDVYDILDQSRYVDPYDGDRWTVVDDAQLRVEHGWACAEAPSAASKEYIGLRVLGFTKLPKSFDGTVFLNGWHLEYKDGDHHVIGLGTSIFNIAQLDDTLVWNAGGVISDDNGDDAYRWCYDYTTVAWARPSTSPFGSARQPHVDIQALTSDPRATLMYVDGGYADGVGKIPSVYKSKGKGNAPRGVLLAGFGVSNTDDDHHVLQLGFDLGKPKIKRKKIKWTSDVVLKDDSQRDPRSAEIVSVLTGESVNVFHPASAWLEGGDGTPGVVTNDLHLTARTDTSNACLGSPAARTVEMAIVTPPYTWAIPMLTGWDIQDPCHDDHVAHVGAWIEDFHYVLAPGAANGTLYYTIKTNFGDEDDFPGMSDRVQVDVLGIDLLQPLGIDPRGSGAVTEDGALAPTPGFAG